MNKKLNYFTAIKFLSNYIKGYRKNFLLFYLGWLLDSLLALALPILFGIMLDEIVYYQNIDSFLRISFVYIICIMFSGGLYFLVYAQHGYLMNMFVFSVRKAVFRQLQECDSQYLSNASTGDIITTLQDYSEECMHFIIRNVIHATNEILKICLYGIYLVMIDWRIGVMAFSMALLSACVNTRFSDKIRSLGDEERKQYGSYISWIYEVITALRDIRMLGACKKIEKNFEEKQKELFGIQVKNVTTSFTAENIVAFVNLVIQLSIYALSAYLTAHGHVTLGVLTVIFNFYDNLSRNIRYAGIRYLDSQNRISYIQRIYDFLHTPKEQGGEEKLQIQNGNILFSNVSFQYENSVPLLKNITFMIHPGEHLAIVGKSGCGKTTLAYLLIGFYRLQNGMIEIDGQRLEDCSLESIRRGIGFVQQDVLVFDGTIRQNLLMGNLHANEEQLEEACRGAGLWEFIQTLPNGLDTVIGSRGIGLSGGQKQRLAIARIHLKNPKIVIFDEATSALDSETEEVIHQVWRTTLIGKTAIIIAHRQRSVMLCDRVAVMEDGEIVETGIPSEMEKFSKRFRMLFAIGEDR